MGKMGKMAFSLCLLFSLIFLTVILCWILSRQSRNIEYIIEDLERRSMKEEPEPETPFLQGQCKFGIDFVGTSLDRTRYTRYRLPNHEKHNFTGTLLGQDLLCLDTMDAEEGESIGIFECHGQGRNQAITFTMNGLLVSHAKLPLCIAVKGKVSPNVVLKKCDAKDESQIWTKDSSKGFIYPAIHKGFCLTAPVNEGQKVFVKVCKGLDVQRWRLVMNEVMLLWVEGAPTDPRTSKIKPSARKHLSNMILQAKPIDGSDIGQFGVAM